MDTNSNKFNDNSELSSAEKILLEAILNIFSKCHEIFEKIDECNSNNTIKYKKSECENRLVRICRYYLAIDNCITSIEQAMVFINDYDLNKYRGKINFQINDICRYHYDVVCHKVSTINDLYFKLINEIYDLKIKKCNWEHIKEKRENINNKALIAALEHNYSTTSSIKKERCKSSHEGRITSNSLSKNDPFFIRAAIPIIFPKYPKKDGGYTTDSLLYDSHTNKMKKTFLGDIEEIRSLVVNNRKALLDSLAFDLEKFYKEAFPEEIIYECDYSLNCDIYHTKCPINWFEFYDKDMFK